MTQRLSVVVITRNVADLLPDCLASVSWADEIVVLDAGSQDNTLEIARAAGAKVMVNSDWQGYGVQRQRAQQLACGDYILMLDADERVTPALAASIRKVLENPQPDCVYSLGRINWFLGRFMRHSGWYPDQVVRLYARGQYQYSHHLVHESLVINQAKVVKLSGDLLHLTCCDLSAFQQKQLTYARAWATQNYHAGRRVSLAGVFVHTLVALMRALIFRVGFLDGAQGWILAMVQGQYTFNKYAMLWALSRSVAYPATSSTRRAP